MVSWIFASATVAVAFILLYDWNCDTLNQESFRGKRVLITGASSGIGEELAYQYSKLGASVVITARRGQLLEKVALKCKQLGAHRVEHVVADMNKPKDRSRVVNDTKKHLGGLDHLILNHAIVRIGYWFGNADNVTGLQYDMEVNFMSYVDIASQALQMLTNSKGSIAVMSSITGKMPSPLLISYASSKFALHGFFASLRQELLHRNAGVSVTIFVLGGIATDMAIELESANFKSDPLLEYVSVEEAAIFILKHVSKRSYEIYYPISAKIPCFLHKLFQDYAEDFFCNPFISDYKYPF